MARAKQETPNADGWIDFVEITNNKARLGCCDCGLTHDFEFKVIDGKLNFRTKTNHRSTAQRRKSQGIKINYE